MGLLEMLGLEEKDVKRFTEALIKLNDNLETIKIELSDILQENKKINEQLQKRVK